MKNTAVIDKAIEDVTQNGTAPAASAGLEFLPEPYLSQYKFHLEGTDRADQMERQMQAMAAEIQQLRGAMRGFATYVSQTLGISGQLTRDGQVVRA